MGTVVQTEAEIDRFMGVTGPAVGLLLDTGHATWGGGDPARIARHWKERIHHVHCKDIREAVMWRSNREDWSFLESVLAGVYTVPGDGLIDYVRVLKELQSYSGWIVAEAEQDPKKAEPATYAKLGPPISAAFVSGSRVGLSHSVILGRSGAQTRESRSGDARVEPEHDEPNR